MIYKSRVKSLSIWLHIFLSTLILNFGAQLKLAEAFKVTVSTNKKKNPKTEMLKHLKFAYTVD